MDVSDSVERAEAGRRVSARFVLGCVGWAVVAGALAHAYSRSVARRYAAASTSVAATIDLNRDDQAVLERLPGIGPTLAQRIVSERTVHGPFAGFAELRERVDGIGPRVELALAGLVAFGR